MRKYDIKNHCCPTCKVLMPIDYFYKHHTLSECLRSEYFETVAEKQMEESWQMILTKRKEKEQCNAQCVKTVTQDKSKQE